MQKADYIYMIIDNTMVYNIDLPVELQGNNLYAHFDKFNENILRIIAGFNKNFLEHFLIISKGKDQDELKETMKKMEQISLMVGPTGNLSYLSHDQIEYVLTKVDSLKLNEINEEKISMIADDQLRKQFNGLTSYNSTDALENQLASAAFYLMNIGYSRQEIEEKFKEVREDPAKLDLLFTLPEKEIFSMPSEIQHRTTPPAVEELNSAEQVLTPEQSNNLQQVIEQHINAIHEDITDERAQKVSATIQQIKDHVRDSITELQEKVFSQIHPDRLNRALKMLKTTKRKSKRMKLYLDWFTDSFLLSKIELKVEHWQVSSQTSHGSAGVYTAGIDFSRYDNIVRDFPDNKLSKVVNIAQRILQNPTKKAIQKLGQDLIAETGFDEHLYFTD